MKSLLVEAVPTASWRRLLARDARKSYTGVSNNTLPFDVGSVICLLSLSLAP